MIYQQPFKYQDRIAVIGVAGRFPKANNIYQYWENLTSGKECIDTFPSQHFTADSKFVNRGGRIENPEYFDESFFGYTPKEASFTDPQHRIFLETGWEALESAGYNPKNIKCRVGVFAGCGMNHYLSNNILRNEKIISDCNEIQLILGNDKDFLTTRLSYKLNLKGPSFDIQTACSSSLVSVHVANTCLLTNQCDIALAGGVFLQIPWWNGYRLAEGDIRSPDGICRPFDANANGTVFGEGIGIIVLKRLQEAIRDRDHIFALIRGSAINNDGGAKAGYTAPGVAGQKEVILSALQSAGITASDITYVEAHGTGTPVGDPIEFSALCSAFREHTSDNSYCALGSVKASIGHLDAAAGIAGLIKTILSLYYKKIPPLVNFSSPSNLINLQKTPFYIPTENIDWQLPKNSTRFAGVSSLGVGGTNAHVILEEAPDTISSNSSCRYHFVPYSSRSENSLASMTQTLSSFFSSTDFNIADCAYTLQTGRHHFPVRQFTIQQTTSDASKALSIIKTSPLNTPVNNKKIVLMFTGQGSLYPKCGYDLYTDNGIFRNTFDTCAEILLRLTSLDFRDILFNNSESTANELAQTRIAQPMLFALEYSLYKLWESIGIHPSAMIGYSLGEYVAACISGVFTLEDALYLVSKRGTFMQLQPAGSMISVNYPIKDLYQIIPQLLQIATVNAPDLAVVSGSHRSITEFCEKLSSMNISFKKLNTSHAFHSEMMEGALSPFLSILKSISCGKLTIPFISNVTGTWITDSDLSDVHYWTTHLRNTVNFYEGIRHLIDNEYYTFLEVGPGNALCSFVKRCHNYLIDKEMVEHGSSLHTITTMRNESQHDNDTLQYLRAAGSLWQIGFDIDMNSFYPGENRYRVPLPTIAFDRKYHWIQPTITINTGIGLPYSVNSITTPTETTSELVCCKVKSAENIDPNAIENIVHKIWSELLGLGHIQYDQNFYEIGGDSIWASQIISRINETFSISLTLGSFFKTPTINGLSAEIKLLKKQPKVSDTITFNKFQNANLPVPLTLSQQRLWFLNQLTPESPAYNLSTRFSITGPFDTDAAHKAITCIVNKHDSLRMIFKDSPNGPVLHVKESPEFEFNIIDIPHLDNQKPFTMEEVLSRSLKPYNLKEGPLLRVLIIRSETDNYLLYVMTHHIISDGWSMGIFLKDFAFYYDAIIKNKQIPKPSCEMGFSDYAKLQSTSPGTQTNELIEYWTNVLSLPLPVIELPSDKIRPPIRSYRGSGISFSIDVQMSKNLEILAKKEHITVFVLFLTAYYILLSKYSGQKDIVIGTPVANRNNSKVENIIGFFLNMLPLRIKGNEIHLFSELLHHINRIVIGAFENQELPFSTIIEHVKPPRDLNQNPIFQVMFAFQNFPLEKAVLGDTVISASVSDRGTTEYDLSLYMWPDSDKFSAIIEYNTDLFSEYTINQIVLHLKNILHQISLMKSAEGTISDLSVLSVDEFNTIVYHWNNNTMEVDFDTGIHGLFKKAANAYPDRKAVVFKSQSLTYSELDNKSDILATSLVEQSINPGDLVGICMERSSLMVSALLGILKAGAAYVPIDPHYPTERIMYMINDAQLKYIVGDTNTLSLLSSLNQPVSIINVDLLPDSKELIQTGNTFKTAYVIYTSGSTGKPKGVRISHNSVVNLLMSLMEKPGISLSDIVLATTTLSFDISVLEIFLPLTIGACCVIIDRDTTHNGLELIKAIENSRATIVQGTPSLWRLLISSDWVGSTNLKALCGGEKLPSDLLKDLLPRVKELWNMYGPTETTVWSTCYRITDPSLPVLIGRPIANTQIYILDYVMKPVPPGVTGDLYIGGAGLAEGYHNKPDLTADRFIKNPFSEGLIYKTGDLARFDHDGLIEYIGRSDSQVKIRGFRIELDEIEKVSLGCTGIKYCTASCKPFSSSDTRLILYYTLLNKNTLTPSQIRDYLRKYLPEYMIPQHFVELDNFPLTPSGKIDNSALPLPEISKMSQPDRPELFTPDEAYLAQIWKTALGQKTVRAKDNFFELGGHSLLSMSIIAQIKRETGLTISPQAFLLQTLEQIAASFNFSKHKKNKHSKNPLAGIPEKLSSYFNRKQSKRS